MKSSTQGLLALAAAGLGGLALYLITRKGSAAPTPPPQPQPVTPPPPPVTPIPPDTPVTPINPTPPKPNTDVSVLPLVDLTPAGFRATQQTMLPNTLKQQELWAGARVAVEGELLKANAKLPPNMGLFYWAYRDTKGAVLLRVMQRNTQNETWYTEATVYR